MDERTVRAVWLQAFSDKKLGLLKTFDVMWRFVLKAFQIAYWWKNLKFQTT